MVRLLVNSPHELTMYFVQGLLIVATLYQLVLVVLILQRTRTYRVGRNLAWYILSVTCWIACIALMQPRFGRETGLWISRATFVIGIGAAGCWLWFCAYFPTFSLRFRSLSLILTAFGLPWLWIAWTQRVIVDITYQPHWIETRVGPLLLPYGVWILVCAGAGVWHLVRKARRVHGIARMQIRYVLLGFSGLLAAFLVFSIVIPIFFGTTRYSLYGPLIASVFVATTTTVSITRPQLLDIKVVMREGAAYIISLSLLALLFAATLPRFEHLCSMQMHLPPRSGIMVASFLLALAFRPTYRLIESLIDRRLLFQHISDFRLSLRAACNALASGRDQSEIVACLAESIGSIDSLGVAIFLPGQDGNFTRVFAVGSWETLPRQLPEEAGALREYARSTDEVLLTEELLRLNELKHDFVGLLNEWEVAVVVPMVAGGQLCGLLMLREKRTGEMYSSDDLGYLRILGQQAAIALDNVRHFDEVKVMNEYHARLLNIMQDGVIAVDSQHRIITFNRVAGHITDTLSDQALGKTLAELEFFDFPLEDTGDQPREVTIRTRDDEEVPVLLSVRPFNLHEDTEQCLLLVFRDLSALHALQQAKMQAERFSSMGAMAASLAHEIKNPLVPIQTFAHLLPYKYDDEEFRKEFSVTVVHEVERINWLVGQMLDLVRKPSSEREEINLRDVVQRLLDIIQPECEKQNIRVHLICAPNLPIIMGVMNQLYQAIMNVLVNAVQAMMDGGDLTVVLGVVGDNLVCRIADTGSGVPKEDLPRIFEPLFTTKTGGHGMGLALTYQFIHFHGGDIRADAMTGSGLTITITLPLTAPDTEDAPADVPEYSDEPYVEWVDTTATNHFEKGTAI